MRNNFWQKAKRTLSFFFVGLMLAGSFAPVGSTRAYADVVRNGLITDENGVWAYYVNGMVDTNYTGLVMNEEGWWYIENGYLDWSHTGLVANEAGLWYVENGEIDFGFTDLYCAADGWYYVMDGRVPTEYTGLVRNSEGLWYVENGKINQGYTNLVSSVEGWYYVMDGRVTEEYTGLVRNEAGLWYVAEGKLDEGHTDLVSSLEGWYYVMNGRVTEEYTGLVRNSAGLWYIANGKVDDSFTGLVSSLEGWFYAMNGRVTEEYSGLVANENGNWYVDKGAVSLIYEGLICDATGWWYIVDSHVATDYSGLATNDAGTWYVKEGYLDFENNSVVEIDGIEYVITGGKVTSQQIVTPAEEEVITVTHTNGMKFELTFDTDGVMTEQKYYSADGTLLGINKAVYNAAGQMLTMACYDAVGTSIGYISWSYTEAGLLTCIEYRNSSTSCEMYYAVNASLEEDDTVSCNIGSRQSNTYATRNFDESGVLSYSQDYTYDEKGNILIHTEGRADGTYSKTENTYHEEGWLETTSSYKNGKHISFSRYNEEGEVTNSVNKTYDDTTGLLILTSYMAFEDGNCTFTVQYDGNNKFLYKDTREYHENGQCKKLVSYTATDKVKESYEYNEAGVEIYRINYTYNTETDKLESKVEREYADSVVVCSKIYTYDTQERLLEMVKYESGKKREVHSYVYREDGTIKQYNWNQYDESGRDTLRNIYYYNEDETVNWPTCVVRSYTYEDNNTIITFTEYNADGSEKAYKVNVEDEGYRTLSSHYWAADGTKEEYVEYLYYKNSQQWKEVDTYRKPDGLLEHIGFYEEDGNMYASCNYYYNAEDELDWYYFREYITVNTAELLESKRTWYDANGNVLQYSIVGRDAENNYVVQKESYYDANDNLVRTDEYTYRADGTLEKWVETYAAKHLESKRYPGGERYFVYTCDETGNLVVTGEGYYLKDGEEYMHSAIETTAYGLLKLAYFYDMENNQLGYAAYEYHDDDTNSPFEIVTTKSETVYNTTNQVIYSAEYYNTQISMAALKSYTEYTYEEDRLVSYTVKTYNEKGELVSTTEYDADGNEIVPDDDTTEVPELGEFPEITLKENVNLTGTTVYTSEEEANDYVFDMISNYYYSFGVMAENLELLHTAEEYMWLYPEIYLEIDSLTKYYNGYYIRFKNAKSVYGIDMEHMYAIRTEDTSKLDEKELAAYNKLLQVNEELGLDDMETDIEKVQAAHDYLILNAAYDHEHVANDSAGIQNESEDCHFVEGTLLNGLAVCSGYASTFRLLMELQGIHCDYITNADHGWNAVELDGKWYFVDVTWDDPDNGDIVEYEYFMVTEDVISAAGGHDDWTCECGVAHVCDNDDYLLFGMEDYVFKTEEEAKTVIQKQAGQSMVTLIYPSDGTFTQDDLLHLTLEELGMTGRYSYYPEEEYRPGYNWLRVLTSSASSYSMKASAEGEMVQTYFFAE